MPEERGLGSLGQPSGRTLTNALEPQWRQRVAAAPPLHVCTHSRSREHMNTHTFFVRSDELSFCAQTDLGLSSAELTEAFFREAVGSGRARERTGRGCEWGRFRPSLTAGSLISPLMFREGLVIPSGCGGTVGSISLPVLQSKGCLDHKVFERLCPSPAHSMRLGLQRVLSLGTPAQSQAKEIHSQVGGAYPVL